MSKTTKRKHVTKEALTEYYIPEGEEEIVKIIGGRGNNLHEVEAADGRQFLVSMPTKFRKNLWVKRGDFVVVDPIKEGNKVLAEISYILYGKQIKYLQDEGLWPEQFRESKNDTERGHKTLKSYIESDSSSNDDGDVLFENPNRKYFLHVEDSDSPLSEDEESSENEENSENQKSAVEADERTCNGQIEKINED